MTNYLKFTFSVGGTTRVVYNYYWARQIELGTIDTIFSVVGEEEVVAVIKWHGGGPFGIV